MVVPSSASNRLSGASGWTEVAGSNGLLLLEGVRPPRARTVESGAVSGTKAGLGALGGFIPFTPWVLRIALRLLQDHLLLPCSAGRRFGAARPAGGHCGRDGVHLRRIQGAARRIVERGPGRAAQIMFDVRESRASRDTRSHSGIRILTTSPDAWSFPATPPRPRWRQRSSPAEGFSSFWTP